MRRTLLLTFLVGCARCGEAPAEAPPEPAPGPVSCEEVEALPLDAEARTFGLRFGACSDGENRTLACRQPPRNQPTSCRCPDGTEFNTIPMDFMARDVPLWKLPGERIGLWERIFPELAAGDGNAARAVLAARCGVAFAGDPQPTPVLTWIWDVPREEAAALVRQGLGAEPEYAVRRPQDVVSTHDEVNGPARFVIGELESAEAGMPCAYTDAAADVALEGRCHLVAPGLLELRAAAEADPPATGAVADGTVEPPAPPAGDEAPATDPAPPVRFAITTAERRRLRIARLGAEDGAPRLFARELAMTHRGGLTREQIDAVLAEAKPSIDACVAAYEGPAAEGTVAVHFVVGPSGRPGNADLPSSSLGVESVETCLLEATKGWSFPVASSITNLTVPLPIALDGA